MRRFLICGDICDEDAEDQQDRLEIAYRTKARPLCLCREPGVPMYVADVSDHLQIKRMPLTGGDHDATCVSYEPPYDLSGLGPLMGTAIKLDPADGSAALRLGFSLSKRPQAKVGTTGEEPTNSVKIKGTKLSLRALLHLLWQESGLTQWTSHWAGKRHWWQVYHHLVEAARNMAVRGENLAERLFVPEPFRSEDKVSIEERRAQRFARLFQSEPGARRLMVVVGEIKEFAYARNGRQVVIKHMPGVRLYLEEPAWRRLQRRFEVEMTLWHGNEASHLIAIATIGGSSSGVLAVDEIALMTVTEQWLPVESTFEERLLRRLAQSRWKFVKGLRFNLARSQPLANVILPGLKPSPYALYVVPPDASEDFEVALLDLVEVRPDILPWIWRVAKGDMPPFPF